MQHLNKHFTLKAIILSAIFLLSSFSNSFSQNNSVSMSVDEAYRAIPHRQTTFNPEKAKMKASSKATLNEMLQLADEAMAQRVQGMLWHQTNAQRGIPYESYETNINKILQRLSALKPPGRLASVRKLLVEAIQEQKDYFKSWHNQSAELKAPQRFNPRHALVKRSHNKLIKAYNLLMQMYPSANPHNKQAFFDHLCALDFL